MKKNLKSITVLLLISFAGFSQTNYREAYEYFTSGNNKITIKNYAGAIADYTEAIKLDTGFLQAYENRGVARYYLKDIQGAIDDYTKALEINPFDYNTYGRRGIARFNIQDMKGAIYDFNEAMAGNKDNAQYYNMRGQAKYLLQDYKSAFDDFDLVIRSLIGDREQRALAFYWRGLVKINTGQKASGCADLNKAKKTGYAKASELIGIYCQ